MSLEVQPSDYSVNQQKFQHLDTEWSLLNFTKALTSVAKKKIQTALK